MGVCSVDEGLVRTLDDQLFHPFQPCRIHAASSTNQTCLRRERREGGMSSASNMAVVGGHIARTL
jgi:hypothetical protein